MATHLDLEEQEQLDQLKAFWKQYGNLDHLGARSLALGGYAAWNGWNWWQRDQGAKAGAMYDELDTRRAGRRRRAARRAIFADMKERYPRTAFTPAGRPARRQGRSSRRARPTPRAPAWPGSPTTPARTSTGRSRACAWPALLLDAEEVRRGAEAARRRRRRAEFAALVADRRGDVLLAQGKNDEAQAAYQKAWTAMDAKVDYRRLVEAKLTALGVAARGSGRERRRGQP